MKIKRESTARKTSTVPTRVYDFGVPWPAEGLPSLIEQQLLAGYVYRKRLVLIETLKRQRVRRIVRMLEPQLDKLEGEYDALRQKRKDYVKKNINPLGYQGLTRADWPEEVREQLKTIAAERKAVYEQIKKLRDQVIEAHLSKGKKSMKREIDLALLRVAVRNGLADPRLLKGPYDGMTREAYEKAVKRAVSARPLDAQHAADGYLGPNNTLRKEAVEAARAKVLKRFAFNRPYVLYARILQHAKDRSKQVRDSLDLGSGTYNWVEKAAKTSFKTTIFNPRKPKWDGTGSVVLQLQGSGKSNPVKGLTLARALSCQDSRFKISLGSDGRQATATIKFFGKGSEGVVDLPFVMHRSLPEDSVIKYVAVKISREGYRRTCSLQLTVESKAFAQPSVQASRGVAINLGWRVMKNGSIRVATVCDPKRCLKNLIPDNDAQTPEDQKRPYFVHGSRPHEYGYIQLDAKMREGYRKYQSHLRASADNYNDVMTFLLGHEKRKVPSWIKANGPDGLRGCYREPFHGMPVAQLDKLPKKAYLGRVLTNMMRWKDRQKLIHLTEALCRKHLGDVKPLWAKWLTYRLEGRTKDDLFDSFENTSKWLTRQKVSDPWAQVSFWLETWRRKEIHLVDWARSLSKRLGRHRREIYRRFASNLARRYSEVVIEKWDKSTTARVPEIEDDFRSPQEEAANAIRQFVGVSILVGCLKHQFGDKRVREVPAQGMTLKHYGCGGKGEEALTQVECLCTKCGRVYDQDENTSRHLWDSFYERSSATPKGGRRSQAKKAA